MKKFKLYVTFCMWISIFFLTALIIAGALIKSTTKPIEPNTIIKIDTIYIHDTIYEVPFKYTK